MRRWRFQIHLSTALLLTFAAGGLLWVNFRERQLIERDSVAAESFETSEAIPGDSVYTLYGWPLDAASRLVGASPNPGEVQFYSIACQPRFFFFASSFNALVALLLLTGVYVLSESWIRWRDK